MSGIKVLSDYTFTAESGSVFGTAADSLPIGLPTEKLEFGIEPIKHRIPRSFGYRGPHESNTWQSTGSGFIPTANTSIILTPQLLAYLLPGIFQSDTPWTGSSGDWTMFTNNEPDLPKPKATNSGSYYTLTRNSPDSNDDERIDSAIPTSLKLTINATDNAGSLMGELEFMGRGYKRGFTSAGTVSHAALTNRFEFNNIVEVSYGGDNFYTDFVSMEMNITDGAKFINDIPLGEAVFPKWEVQGTVKMLANSFSEGFKDLADSADVDSGQPLVIAFGNTSPAANGDLVITSHAYLTNHPSDYTEGEVIEFSFEGVFGGAGEYPVKVNFFYQ